MPKMITITQKACSGCRQCELVCSVKHTGTANPARARIHVVKWEGEGFYLPMLCQQCLEPACAAVCPKDAISRDRSWGAWSSTATSASSARCARWRAPSAPSAST